MSFYVIVRFGSGTVVYLLPFTFRVFSHVVPTISSGAFLYHDVEKIMTNHVKIHVITPIIQYTAYGTLTSYEFPFAIFDSDDLNVYLNDQLQSPQSYTITGIRNSAGGIVTFSTAPTIDTLITIVRNLAIERTTDFQEGGALRANVLNDELDYQIACQQQLADNLNRSMVLPPYALDTNVDLTLPMPEAGKAIVWNAAGTNLENSTVSVNALESTLKGYKTAAQTAATTATNKASIATTQANIATDKANEITLTVNRLNGIQTNCLLEVPQDINLELDNTTLILKAGSKIYVPNGAGIFNPVTITNDITTGYTSPSEQRMFFLNMAENHIQSALVTSCYSGSTAPSGNGPIYWYDTTNNLIKRSDNGGTTWDEAVYSLPLGLFSVTDSHISSIDQVFNGFGFIGSTVFSLPGIKGLIPNGRNSDETLKNKLFTTTGVLLSTSTSSGNRHIMLRSDYLSNFINIFYDERKNILWNPENAKIESVQCGTLTRGPGGVISDFKIKFPFRAVDYNDYRETVFNINSSITTLSVDDRIIERNFSTSTGRWYLCYASGFIIQGGPLNPSTGTFDDDNQSTVTFPKPFTRTDYTILKNIQHADKSSTYHRELGFTDKTTTTAKTYGTGGGTQFIAFGK